MSSRRRVIVIAIALLILPGFWTIWLFVAQRRLHAEIAELRTEQIPAEASDFGPMPDAVPDGENAVAFDMAAARAMNTQIESPDNSNKIFPPFPPYPPQWRQMADAATAANSESLRLVRQARRCSRADWRAVLALPEAARHWTKFFELSDLISDTALNDDEHGDDVAAFDHIQDVLALGETLRAAPRVVAILIGGGTQKKVLNDINILGPRLSVGKTPPASHPAFSAELRSLISSLLDDSRTLGQYRLSFDRDCVAQYEEARAAADHQMLMRPMFDLEAARLMAIHSFDECAIAQPDWPSANAVFAGCPFPEENFNVLLATIRPPPRYSRLFTQYEGPIPRWALVAFSSIVQCHASAVSLAAQLYHGERGHWPADLSALVPDYLPEIPGDPMLAGSPPIGYVVFRGALPGGVDRPIVFYNSAAPPAVGSLSATPNYIPSNIQLGRLEYLDLSAF